MRRTSVISEALNKLNNINENPYQKHLDEDLKGYFKNQYLKKFIERNRDYLRGPEKDVNERAMEMALEIAKIDPTFKGREIENKEEALNKNQGSYFDWLIRMINKGTMSYQQMIDNAQEITDRLGAFHELKSRNKLPSDKKDIMQIKNAGDLQDLINSLGGDIVTDAEEGTSFKSAVKNIRGALISICGFRDEEIPPEIQKTEDALTFLCENNKWTVWKINSIWGAMLADTYGIDWGAGATWCTGGQYSYVGQPRKGSELLRSANNHYGGYTRGAYLVVFLQKDNSVKRPYNGCQLNVDDNNYRVSSFFHSNDHPIYLGGNGELVYDSSGWTSDTSGVLSVFLTQEELLQPIKGTILGRCEAVADAENQERLANGEPYIYTGGKIKDSFKKSIKTLQFEYDGETYSVDVVKHPEYLKGESVNEMFNIKELSEGKPYVYDGNKISENLKPAIKEIVFSDQYSLTPEEARVRFPNVPEDGGGFFAIPTGAFRNLPDVHIIHLPANVTIFGYRCFDGLPEDCVILTPRFPNRRLSIFPQDVPTIKRLIKYADEDVKAFNDEEE